MSEPPRDAARRLESGLSRLVGAFARAPESRIGASHPVALVIGPAVVLFVGLMLALLLAGGSASAEVRRLEAVGVVPVDPATRKTLRPKKAAIQVALREGVERVADSLLQETAEGQAVLAENSEAVRDALGDEMVNYTSRYRIIEDRGERSALFTENAEFDTEYQVVVEVYVDVDRVESQLVGAGLLAPAVPVKNLSGVRIEVRGLTAYGGYLALRELLVEKLGASEVSVVEYGRGRIRMVVATDSSEADLLTDMQAAAPPSLEIVPLEMAEVLVLAVRWDPSLEPESEEVPVWRESQPGRSGSDSPPGARR